MAFSGSALALGGSPAASRVFLPEFGEYFVRGCSNHLAVANLPKALAQLGHPSRFYFLVKALVERMEQKLAVYFFWTRSHTSSMVSPLLSLPL